MEPIAARQDCTFRRTFGQERVSLRAKRRSEFCAILPTGEGALLLLSVSVAVASRVLFLVLTVPYPAASDSVAKGYCRADRLFGDDAGFVCFAGFAKRPGSVRRDFSPLYTQGKLKAATFMNIDECHRV